MCTDLLDSPFLSLLMTRLRAPFALLALLLLLAAPGALAQGARLAPAEHAPGGIHILTRLPDGSVGCDVASEAQAEAVRLADRNATGVRLTPLPSLNRAGVSQFRIVIRVTDQLLARPEALLAFRRAAASWEQIIRTPATAVMDLDYGPTRFGTPYQPNILGSTNSANQFASGTAGPGEIRAAIRARTTDPQTIALVDAIPVPTPSTASGESGATPLGRALGALINLQALGFRPADIDPNPAVNPFGTVANIGFNSAFSYDFNPNDGITPSLTDFEAVVIHEIGHALGFISAIGPTSPTTTPQNFQPWDLYRVRPDAVTPGEPLNDGQGWEVAPRVITPGPANTVPISPGSPFFLPVQVMFDGLAEYETSTATGNRVGGDGQQASHWRDDALRPPGPGRKIGIMDPTIGNGEQIDIMPADVRALQLFGYTVDTTPSTAAAALTIGGQAINIDFLTPIFRAGFSTAGGSTPVVVSNTGTSQLDFAFEVFVDSVQTITPGAPSAVTFSPADGSVAPGGQASLSLNVAGAAGGAVLIGRIHLRTTDPGRAFAEIPFVISVGTPGITPTTTPTTVSAQAGQTMVASVEIRNSGDAPLAYVRVLEPAASDPGTARQPFDGEAVAAPVRGPIVDEPAPAGDGGSDGFFAQLNITGDAALRLYDIAQLPTGEIVAVDGGSVAVTRIHLAPTDLSALTATYTSTASLGGMVTGIAYNQRTSSLWIAVQEAGLVREIRLEGSSIVLTGREFPTGTAPFGMDYSPELDAFFVGTFSATSLYAFDATGVLLPGYPASVVARTNGTTTGGISFVEGLLDVITQSNRYAQAGQFGKTLVGSTTTTLPVIGYGIQRSLLDPNGTMYFTSRTTGTTASIRTIDPPDLPAGVGTRLEAATPLYARDLVAPGLERALALVVDARGLGVGSVSDELAFLTNAPTARVVRFPVTIDVTPVAGEDGAADAIDAVATWPNPARTGASVQLTLSSATTVTVGVYNTLGQRVAVLAQDAPLAAGTHALALRTESLAAGVYVVRVEAGGDVSTHKVTVVR